MNRRVFLATIIVGVPVLVSSFDLSNIVFATNAKLLKAGDVVIAESDTYLRLPKNPKDGDSVQIVVENSTLESPCIVQYESTSIAGDREPLILDSTANFKLIFRQLTQNWELA